MVRVEDAIVTDNNFQWDVFEMDDGSGGILLDDDSYQVANYFASPENGGVGKPSVDILSHLLLVGYIIIMVAIQILQHINYVRCIQMILFLGKGHQLYLM